MTEEDINKIIKIADKNNSGYIDYTGSYINILLMLFMKLEWVVAAIDRE